MPESIAIVASPEYPDKAAITFLMQSLPIGTQVLTGEAQLGTKGAEQYIMNLCSMYSLYCAQWGTAEAIVHHAQQIVLFFDGIGDKERLQRVRESAVKAGKPVRVFLVDKESGEGYEWNPQDAPAQAPVPAKEVLTCDARDRALSLVRNLPGQTPRRQKEMVTQ